MADTYRFIGKETRRRDASQIVTGTAEYLNDVRFHGLLYGKVLRSPHAHAVIKNIDKSRAEKLEGVRAVLSWQDVPRWVFGNPPINLILEQRVRYVGQAVALVAAETEQLAREAAQLIDVEYEILPAVFDMDEALKPDAPQLYDQFPGNILPLGEPMLGPNALSGIYIGDVEKGFAEADIIVEGTCGYENIPNPLPPEPPAAVASWDGPGKLTMWVSNQAVYMNKVVLSSIMGEGIEITAIGGPCGGSFGTKVMSWRVQCYAALLARATGRPVRVSFTKEEHLAAFVLRPATRIKAKVGMKKDGTVTAIAGDWLLDTGFYSMTTQAQVSVGCGEAQLAVRCPNWDLKPTIVCTNRNASGIVRGFGGQELKCALIPLLSRAMARAELDPFEVLKKNFVKPGDGYFWRDSEWYTFRGVDHTKAMDRGAEVFGWKEKWKGWLKPTEVKGAKRRSVGVGIHGNADVGEDMSEAYVRLDPDGGVMIYSCISEHGTGQTSNCIKAVAEVLRVPMETISVTPADTRITPFEFGPAGSRGTYAILSAVMSAAEDAKARLFELAGPMLGTDPKNLEMENGLIWVKGDPGRKIALRDAIFCRTVMGHGRFDADYTFANCMMSFVEIELDTQTGKVDLLRVVNATDVGQIIDPQGLTGQLNGCLGSAGIDSALFEETIIDENTGHMLNANMIDYKWRTAVELPPIENVVFETPFPSHRFHAIGAGEIATAPGPSAILMAVSNAVGDWLHEYPVTPDRILKALGQAGEKNAKGVEA